MNTRVWSSWAAGQGRPKTVLFACVTRKNVQVCAVSGALGEFDGVFGRLSAEYKCMPSRKVSFLPHS